MKQHYTVTDRTNLQPPKEGGYVALLAVLIVGAASLAIAVGLLLSGTDSQRSTLVLQTSALTRGLSTACAEEALQQLYTNSYTSGTANLTLTQGNCSYTITNTGASTRRIDTTSTANGITRKLQIYVTIGASSTSITSWQEVS